MHPRAEQPAQPEDLIDIDEVINAYYDLVPDPAVPELIAWSTHFCARAATSIKA